MSVQQLSSDFTSFYGVNDGINPSILSFAPGRLNFIGEHVDYLGGSVVPAAIDFGCSVLGSVAVKKKGGEGKSLSELFIGSSVTNITFSFISKEVDTEKGPVTFTLPVKRGELIVSGTEMDTIAKNKSLRTILVGAMIEGIKAARAIIALYNDGATLEPKSAELTCENITAAGHGLCVHAELKAVISSTIPVGAGLSSSAALCVALIQMLLFAVLPPAIRSAVFGEEEEGEDPINGKKKLSKNIIARAAQSVENAHCGTNCGIMDQYASINGKANTILEVDCEALSHAAVPLFPAAVGGYQVFLVNSMRAHDLGSNYNEVRADLTEAEEKINAYLAAEVTRRSTQGGGGTGQKEKEKVEGNEQTRAIVDASSGYTVGTFMTFKQMAGKAFFEEKVRATALIDALLPTAVPPPAPSVALDSRKHGRASYAVSEMERVVEFVSLAGSSSTVVAAADASASSSSSSSSASACASAADTAADAILRVLGRLLHQTHCGLAQQLLVSTEEIDKIVAICEALGQEGKVYGARLMGGGFGGCVLALVKKSEAEAVEAALKTQFAAAFPELGACAVYKVSLTDGARVSAVSLQA